MNEFPPPSHKFVNHPFNRLDNIARIIAIIRPFLQLTSSVKKNNEKTPVKYIDKP